MKTATKLVQVRIPAELVFTVNEDRIPELWDSLDQDTKEERIRGLVSDIYHGRVDNEGEGFEVEYDYSKDIIKEEEFSWEEDSEEWNTYGN